MSIKNKIRGIRNKTQGDKTENLLCDFFHFKRFDGCFNIVDEKNKVIFEVKSSRKYKNKVTFFIKSANHKLGCKIYESFHSIIINVSALEDSIKYAKNFGYSFKFIFCFFESDFFEVFFVESEKIIELIDYPKREKISVSRAWVLKNANMVNHKLNLIGNSQIFL